MVAFLSDPAAYGTEAAPVPVERIDTHISHVFLTDTHVYKLKRAIRLPFLDYASPDRRAQACRREVEINRRLAAPLYLGVVPVKWDGRRLSLGGQGQAVDWVVKMARFEAACQFDRLAAGGRLTPALTTELADLIAAAHCEAPVFRLAGGGARLRRTCREVFAALEGAGPEGDALRRIEREVTARLGALAARLDARARHGFVRHCHGDMHLANICLFDGRPMPFDAIEFNDDIARIDVLYDVAFPVMDLCRYGLAPLANGLLNRYLETTRDYAGLDLMPVFLALRAVIRLMALSLNAAFAAEDDHACAAARRAYLDTVRTALAPPPPRLIAVAGLSGSGKSTLARALAPRLGGLPGAIVLRSDGIRKRLFGLAPEQRLGEEGYTPEVSARVYDRLRKDARRAVKAGATVIADATFLRPQDRAGIEHLAQGLAVPFTGLWLDAPESRLRHRLAARTGDASDATLAVLHRQLNEDLGAVTWPRLAAANALDQVTAQALAVISAA